MRALTLCALLLAATAVGCSAAPEVEDPVAAETMAALDSDLQDSLREAMSMQEQALAATRELAATADSATPEALEDGLRILNLALLRGRQEIIAVRNSQVEGSRALIKRLRQGNARVREAYLDLLAHHPDPTPKMMDMGGGEEP